MINAVTLAYLLEHCQSLKALTLIDQTLDENHCRALGDYSRPGLEIVLRRCKLTNAGTSALVEVLGRNQGPTKLAYCHTGTDYSVLADGLRGKSRLKFLKPYFSESLEVSKREVLAIVGALKENKGLVELELSTGCFTDNDETWGAICDSLKTQFSQDTSDTRDLESQVGSNGCYEGPSSHHVPEPITLGYDENKPFDTHNTFG
jgi:hypothetical protein